MELAVESRAVAVTGASQGIGRAVALGLAHRAFTVYAMSRSASALADLARMEGSGGIVPIPLDLAASDPGVLESSLDNVTGPLDAIVHAAGIITVGSLDTVDADEMLHVLRVNAVAPVRLTSLLLPMLRSGASIVFMNSSQGLAASSGLGVYSASKHALKSAADALRSDINERGVRVTSIHLGRTATPMQEKLYADRGEGYRPELLVQPQTVADLVYTIITLPRDAEVTDLMVRPAIRSY